MGKIKAEFMEALYNDIPIEIRSNMTIISVSSEDFKEDEQWMELKHKSNEAFRKLKKREFELREHLNIK